MSNWEDFGKQTYFKTLKIQIKFTIYLSDFFNNLVKTFGEEIKYLKVFTIFYRVKFVISEN